MNFLIGKIIKENRIRLGLSQEDLCGTNLSVTTIYRIENGQHIPQVNVIKEIFERMNMSIPINLLSISEEQFNQYLLKLEIKESYKTQNFKNLEKNLNKFFTYKNDFDIFDMQFYLLYKSRFLVQSQEKNPKLYKDLENLLKDAIEKTIPNFCKDFNFKQKNFFTFQELNCLYDLSLIYLETKNFEFAKHIMKSILKYLKKNLEDENEENIFISKILKNLAQISKASNNQEELLLYAEQGISFSLDFCQIKYLPDFLLLKTQVLCSQNKIQEASESFVLALDIIEETKVTDCYQKTINKLVEKYGLKNKWQH